jgi:hypothetical protein
VLVEGDVGDHCAYAVIVNIHRVDICNSNATGSIDDCVVLVRDVGVKGEGAGRRHAEISGDVVSYVGSVLDE